MYHKEIEIKNNSHLFKLEIATLQKGKTLVCDYTIIFFYFQQPMSLLVSFLKEPNCSQNIQVQ